MASQMRILVVDDHAPTRELLVQNLARQGHAVTAVGTCREARERLGGGAFQILILDVMLPDGSGVDLCRRLRDEGYTTPILLLTARGEVGDRVAGLDAGADDYLAKPFALAEVVARVRALGRRTSRARTGKIRAGALTIDLDARRVYVAD